MRPSIVYTFMLLLVITSCKSKTDDASTPDGRPLTAQEYYQKVIDLEETMTEPLLKTEAEVQARSDKGDFDGVAKSAKAMEDTVDVRINKLKKMEPVGNGSDDFKTVAVRYFEYVKSIYTAYKNIGNAKTDVTRKEAGDKMANTINAQQGVMQNLNNAQLKFAADNGFTIDVEQAPPGN